MYWPGTPDCGSFCCCGKGIVASAHPERAGRAMGILAEKTGIYGMIGGQVVDVQLTNQPIPKDKLDLFTG